MGIFAEGNVNIYFGKQEDADKVHEILTNPNVEEEFKKILGEEKGTGYYNFYDFSDNGSNEICFTLSSGRIQNAEWQSEQVVALLKAMVNQDLIEGVDEFSCSMMMEADGLYCDGSEFEKGGEDE